MGAKYSATGTQTITSSDATALGIAANASTANRFEVDEFICGIDGDATPADVQLTYEVGRITAVGTNTSVTPVLFDSADRAAQSNAGSNHTVEPTYTANQTILSVPLFHRATFRWVAPPSGGLVAPATANNGFGWKTTHASNTADFICCATFTE